MQKNGNSAKAPRITGLDGIRVWGIFLIVASHTGFIADHGAVGVPLMFVLSGFLTVYSVGVDRDPARDFLSPLSWLRYYAKRFFRIIPLYYFCILFFWFFYPAICFGSWESVFRHMTFMECGIHFWYLQQEVVMYLFVPPIFLVLSLLGILLRKVLKKEWQVELVFIVLLLCLAVLNRKHPLLHLYGNGSRQFFRIHLFLMGMATGYFCRMIQRIPFTLSKAKKTVWNVLGNLWILASYAITLFTAPQFFIHFGIDTAGTNFRIRHDMLFGVVAMLWVIAAVFCRRGPMPAFLGNRVFSHLSERCYGIYLFHFLLMLSLSGVTGGWQMFLIDSFMSICVAETLYALIEKPLGDFGRHFSPKKLGAYYANLFLKKA